MIRAIDKSVRDWSSRATLQGGEVVVKTHLGNYAASRTIHFPFQEWPKTNYNQRTFVLLLWGCPAGYLGMEDPWEDRLVDSNVRAINMVLKGE